MDTEKFEDLCEQGAEIAEEVGEAAVEVGKEAAKEIARLLGLAFDELRKIDTEAIKDDLIEALEDMKETGVPIAQELMQDVGEKLGDAVKVLSDVDAQHLYDEVGKATAAHLEGFLQFRDQLSEWMDADIEEGRELVKTAMPVLTTGAAAVVNVVEDVGEDVVDAAKDAAVVVEDIYDSINFEEVAGDAFENIEEAYTQSREAIGAAMKALAGISITGCTAACPLLRIEIFRDFMQTISLFFANLYKDTSNSPWIESSKAFFGAVANFIAVDVAAALQSEEMVLVGLIAMIVAIIMAYVFYIWFVFHAANVHNAANEVREGHETKKWADVANEKQKTVKFTTYAITGCLSVYLPVARMSMELISEKDDASLVEKLTQDQIKIGQYISYFILATFILPLPFILFRLIQNNKPTGTPENPDIVYDIDGEEVTFDDKIYNRLVLQDPNQQKCPFRSLYQGFERRWAYYKVIQLVFKLALVILLILLTGQAQAWAAVVLYATLAGISFYTTPFIDPTNDLMDSSGRIAGLVTGIGGALLVAIPQSGSLSHFVGFILTVTNAVNFVVMAAVFLIGNKRVQTKVKNIRGGFAFTDTVLEIENMPAEKVVKQWDLYREVKHRVWHTFWEGMLLNKCGEEVGQRLLELQDATAASGVENIRSHWQGEQNPELAAMRQKCREHLEGIDVYWNDATGCRDGSLDSKTSFGKMYVVPYPFHCVMVYDDAKDEAFIRDDKFEEFYRLNTSDAIVAKRLVRQKIRALDRWGHKLELPFSRTETATVPDGTKMVQYTDNEGNVKEREVPNKSTVSFECYYECGTIHVGAENDKAMAPGFNVSMMYADGHGSAVLPNTGDTHAFRNRSATMGADHIGLHDDMNETSTLRTLFDQVDDLITTHVPDIVREHDSYRQGLIQKHLESNTILGDGFWYYVFNNPQLSRESLASYLENQEGNEIMRGLPETHKAGLNFLYSRMKFVNLHPALRLWYVFWDDFFYSNRDMDILQKYADDFNPLKPKAICYKVMKREDLEKWLAERELIGTAPSFLNSLLFRSQLFNETNLDALYYQVEELQNPDLIVVKV